MTNDATAINDALLADFPDSAIEDKQGKRYIGHEHIRMRVIEATGNQFDWTVTGREIRDQDGVIRARKSGTIPPVMIVDGVLTIPGLGSRAGTGVQVLEENAGEDTYKAAESDAFKRAAMAFGVALRQLYMGATAATTSRPQTRQQTPKAEAKPATPTGPKASSMTLEQVKTAAGAAFGSKDMTTLDALIATMPPDETYWLALVKAAPDEKALDWALRKASVHGPALSAEAVQEVDAYRTTLR